MRTWNEIRSDLDIEEEELRESGFSPQEARYAARRAFGNTTQIKEQAHEAWGWVPFERFWQDVRYAFRHVRRSPRFAVTVVLTLALGVGSVTAVFSVVNAVLLHPYAFRDPGQIVVWRESIRELEHVAPLLPDNYRHYLNLKAHANTVEDAAIVQNPVFSVSTGADHPQMTEGLAISPNFFAILGVTPFFEFLRRSESFIVVPYRLRKPMDHDCANRDSERDSRFRPRKTKY